jgi:hypothetical protein
MQHSKYIVFSLLYLYLFEFVFSGSWTNCKLSRCTRSVLQYGRTLTTERKHGHGRMSNTLDRVTASNNLYALFFVIRRSMVLVNTHCKNSKEVEKHF